MYHGGPVKFLIGGLSLISGTLAIKELPWVAYPAVVIGIIIIIEGLLYLPIVEPYKYLPFSSLFKKIEIPISQITDVLMAIAVFAYLLLQANFLLF